MRVMSSRSGVLGNSKLYFRIQRRSTYGKHDSERSICTKGERKGHRIVRTVVFWTKQPKCERTNVDGTRLRRIELTLRFVRSAEGNSVA